VTIYIRKFEVLTAGKMTFSGLWFRAKYGDIMLLQNDGIFLQVYMSQPKTTIMSTFT
jgi:hypothetical protein